MEEENQYLPDEWMAVAQFFGIQEAKKLKKKDIIPLIREKYPNYREQLRALS